MKHFALGFSKTRYLRLFFPLLLSIAFLVPPVQAQDDERDNGQEVYLAFRYRNVVNNVVTAYYKNDEFYLPVLELFDLLQLDVNTKINGYIKIHGTFLDSGKEYEIDFSSGYIKLGNQRYDIRAEDYIIKEVDFFLHPSILRRVFDLNFTVDFNNLNIELETHHKLPVYAKYERQIQRQRLSTMVYGDREAFDLRYDRNRSFLDLGFLDYTLSSNLANTSNIYTYSGDLGMEVLGGDIQGSLFGTYSSNTSSMTTNNLRWRYVMRESNILRQISVGQINTMGLTNNTLRGIRISNDPLQARTIFDEYTIQGTTIPQSEVELYMNNAFIEYQEADELGNYRFTVPLTYGNSRLNLRMFGPNGQVTQRSERIQIPFTFQPPGVTNYQVNVGTVQNPLLGTQDEVLTAQSKISTGLTNWLTGTVGAEYYEGFHDRIPTIFGSLSSRIANSYLLNLEAAPDAFYKVSTNVVYPSSASFGVNYTYFTTQEGIYNASGLDQEASGNIFLPINVGPNQFSLQMSGGRLFRDPTDLTRYRVNLNTRFRKLNLRFGYSDTQLGELSFRTTSVARLTGSATYSFSRAPSVSGLLRGAFMRLQSIYNPNLKVQEDLRLSYSNNIFDSGQIQLSAGRNFPGKFFQFGLTLTFDFNKARTNTNARTIRDNYTVSNTLRGSVGFDSNNGRFLLSNRQQVGRSGAAVRLFVDKNNSGVFDPEDELIQVDGAIRLSRAGGVRNDRSGLTYLTQLQPYDRYNIELNKGAIRNPLLVPAIEKFSFVTDPNSYKEIEVPFYISGVIEGSVQRAVPGGPAEPLPGVRVLINQQDGDYAKQVRTFSDGGYYAYEVPPGSYDVRIDPSQLQFLDARSQPKERTLEIRALAEGDFHSGVTFTVVPKTDSLGRDTVVTEPVASNIEQLLSDPSTIFEIQIGSYRSQENAQQAARQAQLMFNHNFKVSYNPSKQLYAVRSQSYTERAVAVNQLLDIQNSQFQNSVLVVVLPEQIRTTEQTGYAIQLGAFSKESNAQTFASNVTRDLGLDPEVYFDRQRGLYKVRHQVDGDRQLAIQQLQSITDKPGYGDVFVEVNRRQVRESQLTTGANFAYQIHVEGVTPQSEQAYLSAITGGLASASSVETGDGPEEQLLVFEGVENWQNVLNLKQRLAQISTIGKPFIVLIEYRAEQ